jgi:YHS domain-containing protein
MNRPTLTRRTVFQSIAVSAAAMVLPTTAAHAASSEINVSFFGNQAVDGYDVISYWQNGEPMEGKKQFSTEYKGATWLFSSAENKATFIADPGKFAPKYGGYCAYAASQGYVADADPLAWEIYQGNLYLNYNKSIREQWRQDREGHIASADTNWPGPLNR